MNRETQKQTLTESNRKTDTKTQKTQTERP